MLLLWYLFERIFRKAKTPSSERNSFFDGKNERFSARHIDSFAMGHGQYEYGDMENGDA